jgi:uncharacterized RmlC-like cupin family protein
MRIRKAMVAGMVTFGMCTALGAQATPPMRNPVDVRTQAAIDAQAKTLLADAQKSPSGIASVTLEKYPGHLTMLIRKGDVMHISPGVPHQTMVAPGKTFTYYVIKVAEPQK